MDTADCPAKRKGVACKLGAPRPDGVHVTMHTTRHGGPDKRGVWHFWGTTMTVEEAKQWLTSTN